MDIGIDDDCFYTDPFGPFENIRNKLRRYGYRRCGITFLYLDEEDQTLPIDFNFPPVQWNRFGRRGGLLSGLEAKTFRMDA